MVKANLTIIGIDPGNTKGIAVLDLDGNLIKLSSSRKLNLGNLGKPIVIGCDVNPVPSSVEKFAADIGVKVIGPFSRLKVKDKRILMKKFRYENNIVVRDRHQRDALVAAILALKRYKSLFNKIEGHLKRIKRKDLSYRVRELVVMEKMPIKNAIELAIS